MGEDVDMCFKNAFNAINNCFPRVKLAILVLSSLVEVCIMSYLANHTLNVHIGDVVFEEPEISNGVPQGSDIRPLFCLVMGNALPNGHHFLSFACR